MDNINDVQKKMIESINQATSDIKELTEEIKEYVERLKKVVVVGTEADVTEDTVLLINVSEENTEG